MDKDLQSLLFLCRFFKNLQKYKIMNIKTLFLVCFLLTFFNIGIFGQAKDKVAKVVIDAGHGGVLPGAVGKLSKEKDINLKVALKVGKLISENLEDVTVIYTRKSDENIELFKRAEIANKNKADLFISIHCNSAENKSAHGVETFVMGVEKSEASIALAKKENADILLEKDFETNYSGFDPNSPEAFIVFSLYSSAYLNWSTILASKVQKHLVSNTKFTDRNVRQGALFVLYKVAMPSILIELGFISNVEEEKYLIREENQELMAVSIYNALVEYKNLIEGTSKPYLPVKGVSGVKGVEGVSVVEGVSGDIGVIGVSEVISDTSEIVSSNPVENDKLKAEPVAEYEIRFRIQFFLSKENLSVSNKKFTSLKDVKKFNEKGFWKYTSGNYKTLPEAQKELSEVKKKFSDAFIIAFKNEEKITIQEAQDLLK